VLASLRARPASDAETVLRGLRPAPRPCHPQLGGVRGAARAPARAPALLDRLLDDDDPDVRDVALEELRRLDPRLVAQRLPRVLAKLRRQDFYEPVTALWTLARAPADRRA
jgi:hypothetical protein